MTFDYNGVKLDSNEVKIHSDGVVLFHSFFGVKLDPIGVKFDSKEFTVYYEKCLNFARKVILNNIQNQKVKRPGSRLLVTCYSCAIFMIVHFSTAKYNKP